MGFSCDFQNKKRVDTMWSMQHEIKWELAQGNWCWKMVNIRAFSGFLGLLFLLFEDFINSGIQ